MRRVFIVLVLTVAGMGVSSGKAAEHADANSNDKTKKEVLKVEQELQQAILKDATNILDRTFADEMVWLTSTGRFLTKSEVLADIHSRNLLEFSFKSNDSHVTVYGNTVVLYRTTKGQDKGAGKNETPPRTVTDVFVKQDGQWKMVAHGATFMAQQ
jgi:hypothetical protein